MEENQKKFNKENCVSKKNNITFIVIAIVLVIVFAVLGWKLGAWYADYEDNNNRQVEENSKQDEDKISLSQGEITELESYLFPAVTWFPNEKVGMFSKEKVTLDNLDNYTKLVTIFLKLENDGYTEEKEFYDTNWNLRNDITEYDYDGYMYYPNINKELIHKYAIKLFGNDDLTNESFSLYNISCDYDDEYKCYMFPGGGTGYPRNVMELEKYEATLEEVVLYHKYVYFIVNEEGEYGVHTSYDSEELEVRDSEKEDKYYLDKFGVTYKSLFKKNKNGEYYWVSSEIVK